MGVVADEGLDAIFRAARTYRAWLPSRLDATVLQRVYELARLGPTSANCCPARFVFVLSAEAKEKLRPCLDAGNVEKTMTAPATVIVAYDTRFPEAMAAKLNPGAAAAFERHPTALTTHALRNGSLQGAYLLIAARALGLDCGPMSGFDNARLDQAFFPDGRWRSNFLINLGYGDGSGLRPRGPRLDFDEACRIE
ncbi:MAG: malonic semialdehyde reductase [Alphaproteobacteria bacterium]|nr:malonic semialdehyde reductase [Alphaproteobacteria bacterium]